MGGINTLGGLNNVSVDYRPVLEPTVQNTGNANQPQQAPGAKAAIENPPVERAEAKSVVRELDVLLLGAASKSIAANAAENVRTVGKSLVDKGVLTKKEASKLESLAADAMEKLKALDKFSGLQLAKALMKDKNSDDLVWSKGFFGLNSVAKAVKAAVEAQQKLSEALGKFNDRLASAPEEKVSAAMQDQFTELQFQCDRRSSEIVSLVFKMHDLVQKDVVNGTVADPQVKALLNATFHELMPREAIMMHGTAEALEKMNANLAKQMRPLAEKLDAFKADGGKVLGKEDVLALKADMETMKNAIADARKNGIEITHPGKDGNPQVTRTEVDKSLLDAMEKVLSETAAQIDDARRVSVLRAREAFMKDVKANLFPEDKLNFVGNASHSFLVDLRLLKNEFVSMLYAFARGGLPMKQFDRKINAFISQFNTPQFENLKATLQQIGFDEDSAKILAKSVDGLNIIKAQFKEMMNSTNEVLKDNGDFEIASSDVRRIMVGETGLSNVVEAKIQGFKPGDVDPATEESNIVSSKTLGSGAAGQTYLLTTKDNRELVFKPELDSRIGLDDLLLGMGGAYVDKQKAANLNLATQDTAKEFGCADLVVKYSVGNHKGQFGVFMEKAKGVSGSKFAKKSTSGDDGIPPSEMHKITDPAEQTKIKGDVAQKLNKLMWLDLITGQGDRHWGNYFIHVDKDTHEVTVKGIDNDASFSATRIGLMKFALSKDKTALYFDQLKEVCQKLHGKNWKKEYDNRVSKDPAIVRNGNTMTIDLTKATTHEARMAIIHTMGLQSIALPEEIDEDFYNHLIAMDNDPAKKREYLNSIAPRISPEALSATEARLNEAIAHAKMLGQHGKVYGKEQWRNEANLKGMTGVKATVTIKTTDGSKVQFRNNIDCVNDYNERKCPSFFRREYLQNMFNPPADA
ncbi:MAG: hypothetical protein ILM98_16145 [Kiritimatiellae bacterium]|nr:hypothetical protein [Kiritimatiellia bacterium]